MNGDLQVTLKDGVQYLLRFGNPAGASFEPVESTEGGDESQKEVSVNRFLMVSARLDEAKFPQPELERVPESVEELKAIEVAKKAFQNPPVGAAPGGVVPADAPSIPKTDSAPAQADPATPATEPAATEAEKPADNATPAEGDKPVEAPATPVGEVPKDPVAVRSIAGAKVRLISAQDPAVAQDPAASQENAQPPELTEEEWKERLEAERERINKENQRRLDQRNDRMEVAKKRVAELDARFADWYYIVSDSEFKRLKIELSDLITTKKPGGANPGQPGLPVGIPGLNIPGLNGQ
jgi:hypothetical protein